MRLRHHRVCVALAMLQLAGAAHAAEKAAPIEQLRELNEQKDEVEFLLRQIDTKRQTALTVLENIEKDVRSAQDDAANAHRQAAAVASKLKAAREKEAQIERERSAVAKELGPRLMLRYRLRGASYLQALLLAPSIGDFLWRRRMIDRILANDLTLIDRLAKVQKAATDARAAVETQRAELVAAEQAARERAEEAKKRQDLQSGVMSGILKQKSTYLRTMEEIERSRQQLAKIIEALPPPPQGLGGFQNERGTLAWPSEGKIAVAFGRQVDPKFKTVLQHKGVDIDAPEGASVHAPFPAAVAYAGWFSGFGNLIILDHGEGYYTLYAHLKELKVQKGAHVEQGGEIGLVGDTGSLKGPYLYFEIRSGSKALDPAQWLEKR